MIQNNNNDIKSIIFEDRQIRKVVTYVDGNEKLVWEKVLSIADAGIDIITLQVPNDNVIYNGFYRLTNDAIILSFVEDGVDKCRFYTGNSARYTLNCKIEDLVVKHASNDIAYVVYKGAEVQDLVTIRVAGNNFHYTEGVRYVNDFTGLTGSVTLFGGSGATITRQWDYSNAYIIPKGNAVYEFVNFAKGYDDEADLDVATVYATMYYGDSSRKVNLIMNMFTEPNAVGTNGAIITSKAGYNGTNYYQNCVTLSFVENTRQTLVINAKPTITIDDERIDKQDAYTAWPLDNVENFRVVGYFISDVKEYKIQDVNVRTGAITNVRTSKVLPNGTGILYLVLTDKNTLYYCELER